MEGSIGFYLNLDALQYLKHLLEFLLDSLAMSKVATIPTTKFEQAWQSLIYRLEALVVFGNTYMTIRLAAILIFK